MTVEQLVDESCYCGENPLWHPLEKNSIGPILIVDDCTDSIPQITHTNWSTRTDLLEVLPCKQMGSCCFSVIEVTSLRGAMDVIIVVVKTMASLL